MASSGVLPTRLFKLRRREKVDMPVPPSAAMVAGAAGTGQGSRCLIKNLRERESLPHERIYVKEQRKCFLTGEATMRLAMSERRVLVKA